MLYQEVALWDAKRTKEKTKYSSGPHQILSMTRLIDKQVPITAHRVPPCPICLYTITAMPLCGRVS